MGSIFRKTITREVPASAKLVEKDGKTFAEWKGKGDHKQREEVVTLSDGRKAVRVQTDTYFAKYRNGDGDIVTVTTECTDKGLAKQVLAQLERDAQRVKARVATTDELKVAERADEPITEHLDAYIGTFRGSDEHRLSTKRNLEMLFKMLGWTSFADMSKERFERWLADESRPKSKDQKGRSARSMNAYHTSLVSFCNWCVDKSRLKANPFLKIPKANEEADQRRPKRALTHDEFNRLAEAARNAPKRPALRRLRVDGKESARPKERLSGPERAEVYAVLVGTGLRLGELRQMRIADVYLDARVPGFQVRADLDKAGKPKYLPLRPELVTLFRRVMGKRHPSELVFNIPDDLVTRFNGDLKRAGIPKVDDRGLRADIHCLRKTFITWLVMAGVAPRVTQELARHADINMTMKFYTDASLLDLAGAVGSLSMLPLMLHQPCVPGCPEQSLVSSGVHKTEAS
jgi:integrase